MYNHLHELRNSSETKQNFGNYGDNKMSKKTYETSVEILTIKEIRAFTYIELGFQSLGSDSVYIDINKKQAIELFKKLGFRMTYAVYKSFSKNDTLRIN